MKTTTITTASGATITATIHGTNVDIIQDGVSVGTGVWSGSQIEDCTARLGAADGGETDEAYAALDAGLVTS